MDKDLLSDLYLQQKKSVFEIAKSQNCSQGKINYWLDKHKIHKRSISDAVYIKHNPDGDPFKVVAPKQSEDFFLLGLGLGLYWGEGTKKSLYQVRLGNSDPYLIRAFVTFLQKIYGLQKKDLRFGLQLFSDMDQKGEERFWQDFLGVSSGQFYKTINTRSGKIGTYRQKSAHGVVTVYFHNKKLRDILLTEIEKIKELGYYAEVR